MFDPVNLLNSESYPHPVVQPRLLETHISWVVLTGPFAYKIKKPCCYDFVDYSSLSRRHHFCQLELQLNRRLAEELYLGVVPIIAMPDGKLSIGEIDQTTTDEGSIVEYGVKMLEFPQNAILAQLLRESELPPAAIDCLASGIAHFHESIEVADPKLECIQVSHIRQDAIDNFELLQLELPPAAGYQAVLSKLKEWTENEFERCSPAFTARLNQGLIRRCHGDMHLNNLVQIDGRLFAFDCIEFNEKFQWIDVVSDLAFPMMDLIAADRKDLAWRLLNGYLETREDWQGMDVLRFYSVYRAMVRAKVLWLNSSMSGRALRDEGEAAAMPTSPTWQTYLSTAMSIAFGQSTQSGQSDDFEGCRLAITFGVSGSGKSTRAMEYLQYHGGLRLRSDIERKRMIAKAQNQLTGTGSMGDELYSFAARTKVYQRLHGLAAWLLERNYSVVVDATFLRRDQRLLFQKLAAKHGVPFEILPCQANTEELVERIKTRTDDPSEATVSVLFQQLENQEALTLDEKSHCLLINSALSPPGMTQDQPSGDLR